MAMAKTGCKVRKNLSFEEAFAQLQEVVNLLEKGDLPLEKTLELFQEGVELTRFCSAKLDEAEAKIEVLVRGEGGKTVPFDLEGTAG